MAQRLRGHESRERQGEEERKAALQVVHLAAKGATGAWLTALGLRGNALGPEVARALGVAWRSKAHCPCVRVHACVRACL